MRTSPPPDERDARRKRAEYAIDLAIAARKLSQTALAVEIGVPRQYLSDVKNGYRSLTEPFARRLSEVSGVPFVWLMHGEGDPVRTQTGAPSGAVHVLALPVLPSACPGEPRQAPAWDGSLIEVSGSAAALAAEAAMPYLLRLSFDAPAGLLRKGDLLLMSQKGKGASHEIAVVRRQLKEDEKGELLLARRSARGVFVRLEDGAAIRGQVEEVGQCLGLIWRAM